MKDLMLVTTGIYWRNPIYFELEHYHWRLIYAKRPVHMGYGYNGELSYTIYMN
jgi:hypothetical protein